MSHHLKEPDKVTIRECNGKSPYPKEEDTTIDDLIPPRIEGLPTSYYRKKYQSEKSLPDIVEYDRDTLLSFCESMIKHLPDGPNKELFKGFCNDLRI